ncbi:MAG: hypothetical protein KAG95_01080 [Bacteroidales bacterium]|nr:hypothetical protein [Bacteroidales bacterium]
MKKYSFILFFIIFTSSIIIAQNEDTLSYELSISDLVEINLITDTSRFSFEPTYDISIEDLMKLNIIKEIKIDTTFSFTDNIPLDDLLKMKVHIYKNKTTFYPSYEMSLKGALEITTKEKFEIKTKIKPSYDLSINGIMNIKVLENK